MGRGFLNIYRLANGHETIFRQIFYPSTLALGLNVLMDCFAAINLQDGERCQ